MSKTGQMTRKTAKSAPARAKTPWVRAKTAGGDGRKRSAQAAKVVPGWQQAGYSWEEYLDGRRLLDADIASAFATLDTGIPCVVLAFDRWVRRRTLFLQKPSGLIALYSWIRQEAKYARQAMIAGHPAWVVVGLSELW